jgi:hypothetical protein
VSVLSGVPVSLGETGKVPLWVEGGSQRHPWLLLYLIIMPSRGFYIVCSKWNCSFAEKPIIVVKVIVEVLM